MISITLPDNTDIDFDAILTATEVNNLEGVLPNLTRFLAENTINYDHLFDTVSGALVPYDFEELYEFEGLAGNWVFVRDLVSNYCDLLCPQFEDFNCTNELCEANGCGFLTENTHNVSWYSSTAEHDISITMNLHGFEYELAKDVVLTDSGSGGSGDVQISVNDSITATTSVTVGDFGLVNISVSTSSVLGNYCAPAWTNTKYLTAPDYSYDVVVDVYFQGAITVTF